ncbi:beta strand repeat-containing protein [Qipengyuania sp. ASV99]|uniref:beta strand repeat-containing protein n=1 Tax=Qipengyuania sp. ASV99 TaxID=3399681 RepID=UPI003A4C62CF
MAYKSQLKLSQCSALALSTGLMLAAGTAQAQSFQGTGVVVEGSATIVEGTGTTDITLQSSSAVIDWTPDDNDPLPFTDILFQAPGTTATFTNDVGVTDFAVLNRILPSEITRRIILDGNIISRIQDGIGSTPGGTVFFYTPGGIVIGGNAVFDVGNLGLTTAEPMTDGMGNFIVNNQVAFQQSQSGVEIVIDPGAVINALSEGSYVAAFAPRILQFGDIAVNGQAALVAGEAGTITFSPDGLFDIQVTVGTDSSSAIEHYGITGGPGSSGAGDNHRVYMVAIPKNNGVTMLIQGGTELGFDIAQSASLDGDVVVLSAGQNITAGQIEGFPAGFGSAGIFISNNDLGLGTPEVLFKSNVQARASEFVNIQLNNVTTFRGDANFAASNASANVGFGANLMVGGDLSLIADSPGIESDVDGVFFGVSVGASAVIDGSLNLVSRAQFDASGDGVVRSASANVSVAGIGAQLLVGQDLILDSSVDISMLWPSLPLLAQGGFVDVSAQDGALINVGGVTRVRADAIGTQGGNARAGISTVSVNSGGSITTGELNVTANAIGGDDSGFGGGAGNAEAGSVSIFVDGTGSDLTVLRANSTGNAALGELDFLSNSAIGGIGISGNGGNAQSGFTNVSLFNSGTLSLPDEVGSPLVIRNTAIGGNTSASFAQGGSAALGDFRIEIIGGTGNLGRLSIRSLVQGGSALPLAQFSDGGSVTGGLINVLFTDSVGSVAFEDNLSEAIAGLGSTDGLGLDGPMAVNSTIFVANRSQVNVNSDLSFTSLATDRTGLRGGGDVVVEVQGGEVNVLGDVNLTGSNALLFAIFDFFEFTPSDLTIAGDVELTALGQSFSNDAGSAMLSVSEGSTLNIAGNAGLFARATNDGNLDMVGRGGNASANVGTAGSLLLIGGDLSLDASADLSAALPGLSAEGGTTQVSVSSGGNIVAGGLVRSLSDAVGSPGGDATGGTNFVFSNGVGSSLTIGQLNMSAGAQGGQDIGNGGGNAVGGNQSIDASFGADITVLSANDFGEFDFVSNEVIGATGFDGNGGVAVFGSIAIRASNGGSLSLPDEAGAPLILRNTAIGGDTEASDALGGDARLGQITIDVNGSSANLGRLSIQNLARGGSALSLAQRSSGGLASNGFTQIAFFDADVNVAFEDSLTDLIAGSGSADGLGADGGIETSTLLFFATRSLVNVNSDFSFVSRSVDGAGGAGGGGTVNVNLQDADMNVLGDVRLSGSGAFLSANEDFNTALASTLNVAGDVELSSIGPDFGQDAGGASLNAFGGSQIVIGGNARIAARATRDANNDGIVVGGNASVNPQSGMSAISIGGNLTIDSGVDLSGDLSGLSVQGGNSTIFVSSSTFAVSGVTRLMSDAVAGVGGSATGGNSNVFVLEAGAAGMTGELSISADARGGNDAGSGAGNAVGGSVSLEVGNGGAFTVLSSNTQGRAELGELDFMSVDAIGGIGSGFGGNANGGRINLFVHNGSAINLPDEIGNPLILRLNTVAGNAEADEGVGGDAVAGFINVDVNNSTVDLGRLSFVSRAIGGSAAPGTLLGRGGNANGNFSSFNINDSVADLAIDDLRFELVGGNGSAGAGSTGGDVLSGSFSLNFGTSTISLGSQLDIIAEAHGGSGETGGSAQSMNLSPNFTDSNVTVAGGISIAASAFGGASGTAVGGIGGAASAQQAGIFFNNSNVDANGAISVSNLAVGGDAASGNAGAAASGLSFANLFGNTVVNAPNFQLSSTATGGSILGAGAGRGGDATSNRTEFLLNVGNTAGSGAFTGNFSAVTAASGGDGGDQGGDGGTATSNLARIISVTPGAFAITGDVSMASRATGGFAPTGVGGTGNGGNAEILGAPAAGDILVDGNVELETIAEGGAGLFGGDALGGVLRFSAGGSILSVNGTLSLTGRVIGGDGVIGLEGGTGGSAMGGTFDVGARNNPGGVSTLVSIGSLMIDTLSLGGEGGNSTGSGDGGAGGAATGMDGFVFGRAINGVLEVTGSTLVAISARGGDGGNGINGGVGGIADGGSLQFGTASGGSVPNPPEGSASFASVIVIAENFGGNGGNASTGTGGDGGFAMGGFYSLLVRGADVTADSVSITANGTGGNGGDGPIAGNGGDGEGGFLSTLVTQAFENPGRGSLNLGTLLMQSRGQGGTGANPGTSFFATGGNLTIEQSDVSIGAVDIDLFGSAAPSAMGFDGLGNPITLPASPFEFTLSNATLVSDTINVVTPGEVSLALDAASTLTARLFNLMAGSFVLPEADPLAPPEEPGVLSTSEATSLIATAGDVVTQTTLNSAGSVSVDAAGAIVLGNVSAPAIDLSAATGSVETGTLSAGSGTIAITTPDSILLGSVDAISLTATSLAGDITSDGTIILTGALVLDAAGMIALGDVSAASLTALARGGDIGLSGLTDVNGAVDLDAAGAIALGEVSAGSLTAATGTDDISALGAIALSGAGTFDAGGSVQLLDVSANTLSAVARGGDLTLGGLTDVNGALNLNALGLIQLSDVSAGSLLAVSQEEEITASGALVATNGIDLTAAGAIGLAGVTAGTLTLVSETGSLSFSDAVAVAGLVDLDTAGSIALDNITAGALTARSGAGDITALTPLAVSGALALDAAGMIALGDVSAASLTALARGGDIDLSGLTDVSGAVDLDASGAIALGEVSAGSLTAATGTGDISALGAIALSGAGMLDAGGSVQLLDVSANTLSAVARGGDITLGGLTDVSGAVDLNALGLIQLSDVSANAFSAVARSGDIASGGLTNVTGALNLDASGSIQFGNLTAGTMTTRSSGATIVQGIWQTSAASITSPTLQITPDGMIEAGASGTIALNSTNTAGLFFGGGADPEFAGYALDTATLQRLLAGKISINSVANPNGIEIQVGTLDQAIAPIVTDLTFSTSGDIRVTGQLTDPDATNPLNVSFAGASFTLVTDTGGVDVAANGGSITISADRITAAETALLDALTGNETTDQLIALFNAPTTTTQAQGVLAGSTVTFNVGDALLIQNTGSADVQAGFAVSQAGGLIVESASQTQLLMIINGQISGGTSGPVTGNDAADAIISTFASITPFSTGSQINGCELTGCVAPSGDTTSTVSAAVNGAITSGSGSSAGTGTSTGGTSGSGTSGSGSGSDGGNDGGGEDGGGDEGDAGGSSSSGNSGAGTGSGSDSGEGADNADDGGGDDDFVIEEDDSSGEAEGGSEGESEGEASEEEAAEEEEAEEEAAEEEEEESQGPASGPISPPPTLIDTNSLEVRGDITDPFSGAGNPALLDPDIDAPPSGGEGAQQ